jgi:hypothetical protein
MIILWHVISSKLVLAYVCVIARMSSMRRAKPPFIHSPTSLSSPSHGLSFFLLLFFFWCSLPLKIGYSVEELAKRVVYLDVHSSTA